MKKTRIDKLEQRIENVAEAGTTLADLLTQAFERIDKLEQTVRSLNFRLASARVEKYGGKK